jgi:activator of HSP90 ATPase
MTKSIHQEVTIPAAPSRVYSALLDSRQFSDLTGGAPARIGKNAGDAFTMFGGAIEGRNVELVPDNLVVQAWRSKAWPAGIYSIVRFELSPAKAGTKLVFDQVGFPDKEHDMLDSGWGKMYWEPLKKFLA